MLDTIPTREAARAKAFLAALADHATPIRTPAVLADATGVLLAWSRGRHRAAVRFTGTGDFVWTGAVADPDPRADDAWPTPPGADAGALLEVEAITAAALAATPYVDVTLAGEVRATWGAAALVRSGTGWRPAGQAGTLTPTDAVTWLLALPRPQRQSHPPRPFRSELLGRTPFWMLAGSTLVGLALAARAEDSVLISFAGCQRLLKPRSQQAVGSWDRRAETAAA
jgi:hypothetical protein